MYSGSVHVARIARAVLWPDPPPHITYHQTAVGGEAPGHADQSMSYAAAHRPQLDQVGGGRCLHTTARVQTLVQISDLGPGRYVPPHLRSRSGQGDRQGQGERRGGGQDRGWDRGGEG